MLKKKVKRLKEYAGAGGAKPIAVGDKVGS
jgi:hypothetical protein